MGNQRGGGLIAVLAVTAALLPLSAFAVLLARADLYVHDNTRARAEAFHTAEAGLEHALAEVMPAATFADLLAGPDGQLGTSDDGVFPFQEGPPGFFPRAPLRYDVRVESVAPDRLRVASDGHGVRGAVATVEALLQRGGAPHVPAALYAAGPRGVAIGPDFLVSGFDHAPADPPDQPAGAGPALPGIGVGDQGSAQVLLDQLLPGEGDRIVGDGGTPSIADVALVDLTTLADALRARPDAVLLPSSALATTAQLGTYAAPQITVVTDPGEIAGTIDGVGVLIAPAGLRVSGALTYSGLVLAVGDVTIDGSGPIRVDGSLWIDGGDAFITLGGSGAITYDRDAIGMIDGWFPGHLQHSVVVTGWREVL